MGCIQLGGVLAVSEIPLVGKTVAQGIYRHGNALAGIYLLGLGLRLDVDKRLIVFHIKEVHLELQGGGTAVPLGKTGDLYGVNTAVTGKLTVIRAEDNAVGNAVAVAVHPQIGGRTVALRGGAAVEHPVVSPAGNGDLEAVAVGNIVDPGIQCHRPGNVIAKEVGGHIAGGGPGDIFILAVAAAVKDLEGAVLPSVFCGDRRAYAHIFKGGIQKPSAVTDHVCVAGILVVHTALDTYDQRPVFTVPVAAGEVAGRSGIPTRIVKVAVHSRRLVGVMAHYTVCRIDYRAVLGSGIEVLPQLQSGEFCHITDVIQIGDGPLLGRIAERAKGIGSSSRRSFVKYVFDLRDLVVLCRDLHFGRLGRAYAAAVKGIDSNGQNDAHCHQEHAQHNG